LSFLTNCNFGWILIKENKILVKKGIKKFQILNKSSDEIILIKKYLLTNIKHDEIYTLHDDLSHEVLFWSISTFNEKINIPSKFSRFWTTKINTACSFFIEKNWKLKESQITISINSITINYKLEDICYIWLYLDAWFNIFKKNNEKFLILINNDTYDWNDEIPNFFSKYTLIEKLINNNSCKIPFNSKKLGAIDIYLHDNNLNLINV